MLAKLPLTNAAASGMVSAVSPPDRLKAQHLPAAAILAHAAAALAAGGAAAAEAPCLLPVILGPMIPRGHIANGFPKPCTFLLPLPLLSAAVAGAVLAGVGDGGLPIDVCCRAICRDGNVTFADTAGVADETVGEVSPQLVDNAPAASVEGAFPVSDCWREAPEDEDAISSVRARKRDWCW